jgi:putative PIN family toxin of toxin-antitoxin system
LPAIAADCNIARDILSSGMRVVLDTDALVAAMRSSRGASQRLVAAGLRRRYTWLVSVPLLIEYEAVLTRREHLQAAGLTTAEIGAVLDAVAAVAEPVHLEFLWRPMLRDPGDDMVLEASVSGQADLLVTFNQRDFAGADRFGVAVVVTW